MKMTKGRSDARSNQPLSADGRSSVRTPKTLLILSALALAVVGVANTAQAIPIASEAALTSSASSSLAFNGSSTVTSGSLPLTGPLSFHSATWYLAHSIWGCDHAVNTLGSSSSTDAFSMTGGVVVNGATLTLNGAINWNQGGVITAGTGISVGGITAAGAGAITYTGASLVDFDTIALTGSTSLILKGVTNWIGSLDLTNIYSGGVVFNTGNLVLAGSNQIDWFGAGGPGGLTIGSPRFAAVPDSGSSALLLSIAALGLIVVVGRRKSLPV